MEEASSVWRGLQCSLQQGQRYLHNGTVHSFPSQFDHGAEDSPKVLGSTSSPDQNEPVHHPRQRNACMSRG